MSLSVLGKLPAPCLHQAAYDPRAMAARCQGGGRDARAGGCGRRAGTRQAAGA